MSLNWIGHFSTKIKKQKQNPNESTTLTPGEGKSSRIEHSFVPSTLIQSRPSYFLPEYKKLEDSWWYRSVLAKKRETLPIGKDAPLYAGSAYNIFSRDFVNWTVTSEIAREMINWSRDTYSPDEFIWATLYRSGIAPNSDPPGKAFDRKWRNTLPRMVKWKGLSFCNQCFNQLIWFYLSNVFIRQCC